MNRFRETLRRTYERIDLPRPVKARILLEISADLIDIYDECLARGMSGEEAEARAIEMFDLSDEALAELVRVHETPLRRFLGSLSGQARTVWERGLLAAVVLFIAAFSGREMLTVRLFRAAGIFVWPVAAASLYGIAMALVNVYRLYIRKEYDPRRIRSGPVSVLAAGVACLLAGLAGTAVNFYRTAWSIAAEATGAIGQVIEWGLSSSALMIAALLAAVTAAVAWFVLDGRARKIEAAETAWIS